MATGTAQANPSPCRRELSLTPFQVPNVGAKHFKVIGTKDVTFIVPTTSQLYSITQIDKLSPTDHLLGMSALFFIQIFCPNFERFFIF